MERKLTIYYEGDNIMKKSIMIGSGIFGLLSCLGIYLASRENVETRVADDLIRTKRFSKDEVQELLDLPIDDFCKKMSEHHEKFDKLEDSIKRARETGVPEELIIHNREEGERFFLGD